MNEKTKAKPKKVTAKTKPENEMEELRTGIEKLKAERIESLHQLRLGANTDVRKPTRLRRQVAQLMTRLNALKANPVLQTKEDASAKEGESK